MEILLLLGIVGGAIAYGAYKQKNPSPPGGTNPPGTAPPPAGTPPPLPSSPPPAPGIYPTGTPQTVPVAVTVVGGDGYGTVTVTPGGSIGPNPGDTKTFWYAPGTRVHFSARTVGGVFSVGTAFDHFEGPGVSTRSADFDSTVQSGGFVRGVFATFGWIGG